MKAIAVHPGKPNSIHLRDIPEPKVTDVADGRGVLVKVIRVGVDGTDKEINAAEYGAAPPGDDFLVTGHESFGQVVEVGPNVPTTIVPGSYVVASVRRPGSSIYGKIGLQDFTTDDVYFERGINLLHGYLTEYYVEDFQYVFPLPASLADVAVLLEPTTVAEKGVNHAYEIQRRLKVWQPRNACVLGSGTVGLLTALVARLRGLELTVFSLPQTSSARRMCGRPGPRGPRSISVCGAVTKVRCAPCSFGCKSWSESHLWSLTPRPRCRRSAGTGWTGSASNAGCPGTPSQPTRPTSGST